MKTFINPKPDTWKALLKRPSQSAESLEKVVREVFEAVAKLGDLAVREYTKRFDGVDIPEARFSKEECTERAGRCPQPLREAIDLAYSNIHAFHNAQKGAGTKVTTAPGVECWTEKKPIEKVGIYIPGGTAPLFSTVLMLGVPAQIAGCREIVLCSPPDQDGALHPAICYAAMKCGVTTLCRIGGIQAIAALTHGTSQVPAVYKLFGPGNQYVTQAKQWATRLGVSIDMPAGPSELMVVADHSANPEFMAADLLSQAEHGRDSQVLLLTDEEATGSAILKALQRQLSELPRRDIAREAISHSRWVVLPDMDAMIDMINQYAPEHLIISHSQEVAILAGLRNAGSVFLGNYSPESAGDYASGTNHTLPTNGYARQYSGVNLDSFLKSITFQRLSREGIQTIGPAIETMAKAEGLQAHRNAVTLRLKALYGEENTPEV